MNVKSQIYCVASLFKSFEWIKSQFTIFSITTLEHQRRHLEKANQSKVTKH